MHFPCRENISLELLYMPGSQMNQSNSCFKLSRPSQRFCVYEGSYSQKSKAHFPGVAELLLPWLSHGCSGMQDQKPQCGIFRCTFFLYSFLQQCDHHHESPSPSMPPKHKIRSWKWPTNSLKITLKMFSFIWEEWMAAVTLLWEETKPTRSDCWPIHTAAN